jgi:hypothetical protein
VRPSSAGNAGCPSKGVVGGQQLVGEPERGVEDAGGPQGGVGVFLAPGGVRPQARQPMVMGRDGRARDVGQARQHERRVVERPAEPLGVELGISTLGRT